MPKKRSSLEAEKKSTAKATTKSEAPSRARAARPTRSSARPVRAKSGKAAALTKTTKASRPTPASASEGMPSTVARSAGHAQSLWRKALASAERTYGDGAQAHRVAYSALKHEYEKSGNRWVRKDEAGPSDAQAARGPTTRPRSTEKPGRTGRGHVVRKSAAPAELHAKSSGR